MSEKVTENNVLDLSFFMPGAAPEVEEVEEVISRRFKDKNNKPILFKFKPLTTERVNELQESCKKAIVKKNRVVGYEPDNKRFMARLAVETTVYPNFRDEKLRKAYGTEDATEIAEKVLHIAGEYADWIAKAAQVNGFDDTIEDLEEEAKNS